jgi:hypothetical protein
VPGLATDAMMVARRSLGVLPLDGLEEPRAVEGIVSGHNGQFANQSGGHEVR